jgi:hypothetical protein
MQVVYCLSLRKGEIGKTAVNIYCRVCKESFISFLCQGSGILFVPNYSKKPFLTASDEEYTMLIEVSEEFEKQNRQNSSRGIWKCN